jgi:predicted phage replisome organizer
MADVKWIKITTDVFDDEKVLMIESMPSADSIIVIWFKLLAFAGKQNNDGVFLMSNRIAYTDEMLASIFRRDVNMVRMALNVFEQFGMIEIVNNVITIPNWNKHQTLDAYEKKKERDRLYQQTRRAAQRALIEKSSDSQQTQSSDVAVSEEEKEKDIEKELDNNNILPDSDESSPAPKKSKPVKHKYGEYNNVLLTDEELDKLKDEYIDWQERIENLSSYVASTGKSYKSHYATIRNWARKDQGVKPVPKATYQKQTKAEELDDFYKMAAQFSEGG